MPKTSAIEADRTTPEKGGAVQCWVARGVWLYVQRVNEVAVSVLDNWGNGGQSFARTVAFDKLADVMSAAAVETARAAGRLRELPDGTGFALACPRSRPHCLPSARTPARLR